MPLSIPPRSPGWSALLLACASFGAHAQHWQPQADLKAAGAAASIVGAHLCFGASVSALARDDAAAGLAAWAQAEAPDQVEAAMRYVNDSANLKVRALWQAQTGKSCSQLDNLRYLAAGTGFNPRF